MLNAFSKEHAAKMVASKTAQAILPFAATVVSPKRKARQRSLQLKNLSKGVNKKSNTQSLGDSLLAPVSINEGINDSYKAQGNEEEQPSSLIDDVSTEVSFKEKLEVVQGQTILEEVSTSIDQVPLDVTQEDEVMEDNIVKKDNMNNKNKEDTILDKSHNKNNNIQQEVLP